jgi:hypothetical protein
MAMLMCRLLLQDAHVEQAVKPNVRVTLFMGPHPTTRLVLVEGRGREVLEGRLVLPSGEQAPVPAG